MFSLTDVRLSSQYNVYLSDVRLSSQYVVQYVILAASEGEIWSYFYNTRQQHRIRLFDSWNIFLEIDRFPKTGRHDIAEILLKVTLNTEKSNQINPFLC
jgi:hypothetical protein